MIKSGGQGFGAATVPLIHADNVHAQRQSLGRNSEHVLRFARAFEAVDDDDGQRCSLDPPASDNAPEP